MNHGQCIVLAAPRRSDCFNSSTAEAATAGDPASAKFKTYGCPFSLFPFFWIFADVGGFVISLRFRWTKQDAPAASNFEHNDSAAWRLSNSTRTRTQMGAAPVFIVVRTRAGSEPPSKVRNLLCISRKRDNAAISELSPISCATHAGFVGPVSAKSWDFCVKRAPSMQDISAGAAIVRAFDFVSLHSCAEWPVTICTYAWVSGGKVLFPLSQSRTRCGPAL